MAEAPDFTSEENIPGIISFQKAFFETGKTLDAPKQTRIESAKRLIETREKDILRALFLDFKKPKFETLCPG